MPAVVAQMLAALEVEPGMQVLEIGTGTGYNAALLAYRLGAENTVSVEVDPAVAEHARRVLATAGFSAVTVVTAGRRPARGDWCSPRGAPRTTRAACWRSPCTATPPRRAGSSDRRRSCGCVPEFPGDGQPRVHRHTAPDVGD